jgi:malate permease and related proteins
MEFLSQLSHLFYTVVFPMLALAGIGFVLQRTLGLDMRTLTRLNFYFVVPGIMLYSLLTVRIQAGEIGMAILFTAVIMAAMFLAARILARLRGLPRDEARVASMTAMFYNSGNYGLPVMGLAFNPLGLAIPAMALQVFVMLTQNISSFTVGIALAQGGRLSGVWRHVRRFPPIYTLALAGVLVLARETMGPAAAESWKVALAPVWQVVVYTKEAFFAIALATLGAQLAEVKPPGIRHPVWGSVWLRLVGGPILGLALVHLLGLHGLTARVLFLSTAMPTAINCLLLCLEFDNHPEYAAPAVLYSTLISPITVTACLWLTQSGLVPAFLL